MLLALSGLACIYHSLKEFDATVPPGKANILSLHYFAVGSSMHSVENI